MRLVQVRDDFLLWCLLHQEKNCTIIISDDRYIEYKSEVQTHLLKITHDSIVYFHPISLSMNCIANIYYRCPRIHVSFFKKTSCLERQSEPPISALYLDQKDSTWHFWSNFLPPEEFLTPIKDLIPTNIKSMTQATYLDNWYMYFLVPFLSLYFWISASSHLS